MMHGPTSHPRVLLAHSGGAPTTVAIPWLVGRGFEVVTLTLDLGQGRELAAVREQALALGAVRAHVIDAREELVRDFIQPALRAGIFVEGQLSRTVSVSHPLIAHRLVELARMESASAIAIGGAPSIAAAIAALASDVRVISLVEERDFAGTMSSLARELNIPLPASDDQHVEATVWGRVVHIRGRAPLEEAYRLTRAADETPGSAAVVDIDFEAGVPVRTNGVEMSMGEMIESLETIAGAHGVGRDLESGDGYAVEAPAALVLQTAHRSLATAALGQDLANMASALGNVYADLLVSGRWFSDVRHAIDGFIDVLRPRITGRVRLQLLRGAIEVCDIEVKTTTLTQPKAVA